MPSLRITEARMIARYKTYFLPMLLLLMSLAGCKVDSINPISSLESAQPDVTLYGLWRHKAKGELTYVHIGPEFSLTTGDAAVANKRTRIILIDHKANGITEEAHVAYTSRVGKQRYLNVVQVEDGKPAGYIFVQYTLIDNNTLRFSMMNEDVLKAAIRSGQIKGTTRGEGLTSETAITAESGEIENYLRRDGGKLFTNPVVLRRVQDR
jgi:hypothetical protein